MPAQSFSMVAEKLGLSEEELRKFIAEQKLQIGGRVNVLSTEKIKLIEERLKHAQRIERKQQKKTPLSKPALKKEEVKEKKEVETIVPPPPIVSSLTRKVTITAPISPKALSLVSEIPAADIIKKLVENGIMITLNEEIDFETAAIVAAEFGVELIEEKKEIAQEDKTIEQLLFCDDPKRLHPRPVVVTIMGHVDHGKTTLLDVIRNTNVVADEVGGITQQIGAYQVEHKGKKITFLDTPGHEAFTAMRARGAQVTDLAVLVVAADDGVRPQTIEAINHAKAAEVPIVVAINKIDKPGANVERVKKELSEHDLLVEAWGGKTVAVEISAKQKKGIDDLLEMILLVADLQELKAVEDIPAVGTIIESELDKGKGPVATVLIQGGILHIGDTVVVGPVQGKVRALTDYRGKNIKRAKPADPAVIVGLSEVPKAGDILQVFRDEKKAKNFVDQHKLRARASLLSTKKILSLDELSEQLKQGSLDQLNIILKADTKGSIEAIKSSFDKIDQTEVRINVIHEGIGEINNSDVALASASSAIILGFNVKVQLLIEKSAKLNGVEIRLYDIIYNLLEQVEQAIQGILKAKPKEKNIGKLKVKELFATFRDSVIIGGEVTEGYITKKSHVKIFRKNDVLGTGKVKVLRRIKEEVDKVDKGLECGLQLSTTFRKIKPHDILDIFEWE